MVNLKNTTKIAALCCLVMASGCTTNLYQLQYRLDTSNEFAAQYESFSASEAQQRDWSSSEYFARKGLLASSGESVMPEDPANWDITSPQVLNEMQNARTRLIKALNTNKDNHLKAEALVNYDCWVEQQEEGWQCDDISQCKSDFYYYLNALEGAKAKVSDRKAHTEVFFDLNSSKLTADAKNTIRDYLKDINVKNRIVISGYADTTGAKQYNNTISGKRAETVAHFVKSIVGEDIKIETKAYGETHLLINTKEGVKESCNRRAIIELK